MKKTDEGLVDIRKNGVTNYIQTLANLPNALRTVAFLDFVLPKWKEDLHQSSPDFDDSMLLADGSEASTEEALPAALPWSDEWLGTDDLAFWADEAAVDEDASVNLEEVTANQLIARVTCTNVRRERVGEDEEFDAAFLATFRGFLEPQVLMAKLWQRSLVPGLRASLGTQWRPPSDRESSDLATRVLNEKFLRDQAEDRLPQTTLGRSMGLRDYEAMNEQKICMKVFIFVRSWVEGYYTQDFAEDEVLQGMLHGFIMRMQDRDSFSAETTPMSEEAGLLRSVWTTQRKLHRGVADTQTLRSSVMSNVAGSRGSEGRESRRKKPPPPPILPAEMSLQVTATKETQKEIFKQREFKRAVSAGSHVSDAQWTDEQLWHTQYTAEIEDEELSFGFFEVAAEEIARQLTLVDYTYFCQIACHEVVGAAWLCVTFRKPHLQSCLTMPPLLPCSLDLPTLGCCCRGCVFQSASNSASVAMLTPSCELQRDLRGTGRQRWRHSERREQRGCGALLVHGRDAVGCVLRRHAPGEQGPPRPRARVDRDLHAPLR